MPRARSASTRRRKTASRRTTPELTNLETKLGEVKKTPHFEVFGQSFFELPQFDTAQTYFLFLTGLLAVVAVA